MAVEKSRDLETIEPCKIESAVATDRCCENLASSVEVFPVCERLVDTVPIMQGHSLFNVVESGNRWLTGARGMD